MMTTTTTDTRTTVERVNHNEGHGTEDTHDNINATTRPSNTNQSNNNLNTSTVSTNHKSTTCAFSNPSTPVFTTTNNQP